MNLTYNIRTGLRHLALWNLINVSEATFRRCFTKWMFLKISQNSKEKACVGGSFEIKFQAWRVLQKYLTAFSLSKFPFKIFNLGKVAIALVIWTKLYAKYALFQ